MNIIEKIEAIHQNISGVTAKGPDNWNRLLGCVQMLDEVKKELIEMEVEEDG